MENIELILSIAGTALGLLITSVTFIAKFFKSSKGKKAAEQIVQIGNAILPYIKKAESFAGYTGAEKKEYVMTKANQFAISNNITFDPVAVGQKVEELVGLTKQVNKRNDDGKTAAAKTASMQKTAWVAAAKTDSEAVFDLAGTLR